MENAITTINEDVKVTEKLLCDYLSTLTESLNDNQRMQFLAVAKAFNLNPFKREIYAVKYGNNFNIITGYEVYLKRAETFPTYDGYDVEFGIDAKEGVFCKCHVFRKDRAHSVSSMVWMKEYNTGKSLWLSKPRAMLEKVAICTAFRRAFPSDFGGMPYAADEMPEGKEISQKPEVVQAEVVEENSEPAINSNDPKVNFKNSLMSFKAENERAFLMLTDWMKAMGWSNAKDVPNDKYADVLKKWSEYVNVCNKEEKNEEA